MKLTNSEVVVSLHYSIHMCNVSIPLAAKQPQRMMLPPPRLRAGSVLGFERLPEEKFNFTTVIYIVIPRTLEQNAKK